MNFFHAVNASGCDTFLKVDDIVSILHNDAKDHVLVGMRNGEQYGFNGNIIRSEYNKAFPNRATNIKGKNIAVQLFEILQMLDKFVKQ